MATDEYELAKNSRSTGRVVFRISAPCRYAEGTYTKRKVMAIDAEEWVHLLRTNLDGLWWSERSMMRHGTWRRASVLCFVSWTTHMLSVNHVARVSDTDSCWRKKPDLSYRDLLGVLFVLGLIPYTITGLCCAQSNKTNRRCEQSLSEDMMVKQLTGVNDDISRVYSIARNDDVELDNSQKNM